jgi:hypothetical protein
VLRGDAVLNKAIFIANKVVKKVYVEAQVRVTGSKCEGSSQTTRVASCQKYITRVQKS